MKHRSFLFSLLCAALPVAFVAGITSLLSDTQSSWYVQLRKPIFTPPEWVFPLAWSIVYLCDFLALYSALRKGVHFTRSLTGFLLLCGGLNILWSYIFFELHLLGTTVIILFLLLALLYASFRIIRLQKFRPALWLLPNLLWGSFALFLNIALTMLNI